MNNNQEQPERRENWATTLRTAVNKALHADGWFARVARLEYGRDGVIVILDGPVEVNPRTVAIYAGILPDRVEAGLVLFLYETQEVKERAAVVIDGTFTVTNERQTAVDNTINVLQLIDWHMRGS